MEVHTCEMCHAVTGVHWVLWQNAHGWRLYFCDNDCLAQWLTRGRVRAIREVVLACQHSTVKGDAC